MYKTLSNSASGKSLKKHLARLQNYLCDIRTMEGLDEASRKGRLEAVKVIEEQILRRLGLSSLATEDTNPYV